ncbi:MAG: hypothetical protein IT285_14950 [Bdellovibrionales bacterium]|nr:hypothetical protein [Bdellovibrionales bacterium]
MTSHGEQLRALFTELDRIVDRLNAEARAEGMRLVPKAKIRLLGQMSLMVNEKVSAALFLAQTADLDAMLEMENVVKGEFVNLLKVNGLVYDEDSPLIWIPPGAKFDKLFDFEHLAVESIDPESTLVSKAVKAPEKNLQLIRQAIASGAFPTLMDRIVNAGGDLERFA